VLPPTVIDHMTNVDERLFMVDLAIVQLISGILVTLGSTLLAISIGFGLTIPGVMQNAILQMLAMETEVSAEVQQLIVQESLSNHVLVLAAFSILLIIIGVLFASSKIARIRRQIKANRNIADLLRTDISKKESITNQMHPDRDDLLPNLGRFKSDDLTIGRRDQLSNNP